MYLLQQRSGGSDGVSEQQICMDEYTTSWITLLCAVAGALTKGSANVIVAGDFKVHHRLTNSPWIQKRKGSSVRLGKQLYAGMLQQGLEPKMVHGVDTYRKVIKGKVTSNSIIDQVFATKNILHYELHCCVGSRV